MTGAEQSPNPQTSADSDRNSPYWSTNAKLVVGMTLVALAAGLLIQIRPLLTPLVLAVILSYLLYPMINSLEKKTFLSWRGSTNVIFIILLVLLITSLTVSVVAIVNQFQNLIKVIDAFLNDLPTMVQDFISNGAVIQIPIIDYQIDIADYFRNLNIDLLGASEQVLSAVQPILSQAGSILTKVATSAISTLGWGGFILVVAYLSLGEVKQGRNFLKNELEGMSYDIGRMTRELGHIWNAFLRGQMLVFFLSTITMLILMSILGVRYALGLAIVAGMGRFVPYVGQGLSAILNAVVAYFLAESNYLGMDAFPYMLLVVGLALLHDQIYDSLVIPRLIGNVLGVHPALVLIVAIIATRWIGVLGLLVAAPVLASFQLVTSYVIRKLLDQDPWPESEIQPPTLGKQIRDISSSIKSQAEKLFSRLSGGIKNLFDKLNKRKKQDE
jgi:predicted PurR-regulated permease PerM